MRTTNHIALLLIGLLWSMSAHAQALRDPIGQFDVAGYPGNSFPVVLTFPAGVPASLSVVTKYAGTATPLPANRQPTLAKTANTATVTFLFPISAFEWQGYHEIAWGGRVQIAGDIIAKLANRTKSSVITTLLVKSADATQISISLVGGAGGGSGSITAADIASVGNALYRKIGDPISWLTLTDRPQIPTFPAWIPTQDPGFQTLGQVNALIGSALSSVQQSLTTMANDIASRVPFATYTANRSTDQNATAAAQATANSAQSGAQTAQSGVNDIRSTYVPNSRRIRFNGGTWQTFGADLDITVSAGQAGVNSLNGKNGNLTGFVETADLAAYNTRITNVESGKVNIVAGLGLSANDFTNALLAKLNSVQAGATNVTDNLQLLNGAGYAKSADVNQRFATYVPSQSVIWAMFGGGNGISYAGNGTFHLQNDAIAVLVKSTLRGIDGFDENIPNQVLSHVGVNYRWIAQSSGTGSTTTTTGSGAALSMRDSVMYYADSTKMRFAATGTTVVNISTTAQLRSFLTTTQTNVRGVLANGTYGDGNAFEQTGAWTNVSLEAANFRQAILENTGGNLVWINQGGSVRRRVRLKDFVIRTGALDNNNLAMFHHNELPDWDGLEIDGVEMYHTNPTQGHTNGLTIVPFSEGSKQGKILRNIFIHNTYIHDIPRANEFLSHGFGQDWIYGIVVTNSRFVRMGQNDDFGAPLSYSGTIKGIYTAKCVLDQFKYAGIEHVANRLAIDSKNTITNTVTNGGVGIAISDNNLNLTRYIWAEDNNVNVMSRPFYAYGVKDLTITGGTYIGRLGADGTPKNSTFKNFNLTVWARAGQTIYNYVWQFDGDSNGNTVTGVTASSGGTQANTGGPTAYTIHLQGGTYSNTFDGNTTILGKNTDGSWPGSGGIVNDGANTNVITNTTTTRVD